MSDIVSQIRELVESTLTNCSTKISKSFKSFIIDTLILYLVMNKVNFTQLERYGTMCEKTYRNNFSKGGRSVDAIGFNLALAKLFFEGSVGCRAVAIDPSYISHSGKCTPGMSYFWSGCAQAAKWGLEILGIGIVDTWLKDCIMLTGVPTPAPKDSVLKAIDKQEQIPQYLVGAENISDFEDIKGVFKSLDIPRPYHKSYETEKFKKMAEAAASKNHNFNLLSWYLIAIQSMAERLKEITDIVVADAFFSKRQFVDGLHEIGMSLVSRFRDDACLMYLYKGQPTGKPGRPKIYDGKVDLDNLNKKVFFEIRNDYNDGKCFCGVVYSKALRRAVKVVIWYSSDGKRRKIYFSTETKRIGGANIINIYRTRFQIEFRFREAKEYTSLCKCQARSISKMKFNYNMSFTSINCLKYIAKENQIEFSMGNLKTILQGHYLLQRFISVSGISPNSDIIKKLENEVLSLTAFEQDVAA